MPTESERISPGHPFVAAADVGGTAIKGALLGAGGSVKRSRQIATVAAEGPRAVVGRVVTLLRELAADVGEPLAVGVAVPGVVDEERGVAVLGANLGWQNTPVRDMLQPEFSGPVTVMHDVRAGGLAEARLGAARGSSEALFVALGTGVAAALFRNGEVHRGAHGLAGEIGHVQVEPDGPRCGCGGRGCLETVASAAAIARRYRELSGEAEASAATVVERVESGDPLAARTWSHAVRRLGWVLALCQSVLDVDIAVLGGGLAGAGDYLLDPLRAAIRASLTFQQPPELAVSELGGQAGCLGAGLAAWDSIGGADVAADERTAWKASC